MPRMSPRSFVVRRNQSQWTLFQFLRRLLGKKAERTPASLRVLVNGRPCPDLQRRLKTGDEVRVETKKGEQRHKGELGRPAPGERKQAASPPAAAKSGKRTGIRIVHVDDDIVVVDKPAGLTTVRHAAEIEEMGQRARRFLPLTLLDLLPPLLPGQARKRRVRAVHRLDRETTGLVVFALNPKAETALGKQFRAHSIERRYLALVRGAAQEGRIESHLVRDRGDGRRGSGPAEEGQRAVTLVRVRERFGTDFTLVECELQTGRTHQVRIHLGEAGTPLCGERLYDRPLHGPPLPDASGAERPLLHAAVLAIDHPVTGERLRWESRPPDDLHRIVRKVRGG